MNGLIKMIEIRGGLKNLNKSLQGKICMFVYSSNLPKLF